MEDFNVNYFAHHVRFIYSLLENYDDMNDLGECQEPFEKVTKEALLRDFASRAFYTVFLKARDEMYLSDEVSHNIVQQQLSYEYKNIFRDLKAFRVESDYKTSSPVTSPLRSEGIVQCYPERLIGLMDVFLSATGKQLAHSHIVLAENLARQR